jgi:multidrug resistance efflux pump
VVHISDPNVRVVLNGKIPLLGVGTYRYLMTPCVCAVEAFKWDRRVSTKSFYLEPGKRVELEVDQDGELRRIDKREELTSDAYWRVAVAAAVARQTAAKVLLDNAYANRKLVREEYERIQRLRDRGAVPMELVDETRLRLTTAENDVVVAEADVALAQAKKRLAEVAFEKDRPQEQTAGIAAPRPPITNLTESELARDMATSEVMRAKANLAKAAANLTFQTKQHERMRQLHEKGAAEKNMVSETEAQVRAADANLRAAEAAAFEAAARLKAAEKGIDASGPK